MAYPVWEFGSRCCLARKQNTPECPDSQRDT
nr:MAG TPA: endonuclease III [Caudoviricetes sp.]